MICLLKSSVANRQPNVLLMIVDDLGWNDVGFTDNKLISTPNIDSLAKEGIILSNYYVSSICSPSRSALLTGYHPIHTGMQHDVIASDEPWGLPQQFKTLPQYLKSLNYSTHLIGKWHQGFYSKRFIPTERGFDTFNGYLSGATDYYDRITRYGLQWGLDWYEDDTPAAYKYAFNHTNDILTDQTIKLISQKSQSKNEPWFIAISYQAVHIANSPKLYQVPVDYLDRFKFIKDSNIRSYVALLASLDDSIGTIFNHLHKTGQANSTLIVFTSDNGAPTGTLTGKDFNLGVGSNQPLRGAKYTLWEGGIKGLSWIWANWLKSKGTVYNGLSHITDWTPTLFSFAGGNESNLPENIDGINLRHALEDNWDQSEIVLRDELLHNIDDLWNVSAIRKGAYKLVTGTVFDGQFDDWVSRNITIVEHLFKKISPSSKESPSWFTLNQSLYELDRKSIDRKNVLIKIDCSNQIKTDCNPVKDPCLFNIELDPCEFNNIASTHQDIVNSMLTRLNEMRKTAVPPVNRPGDPLSAPIHHEGYWTWWLP